MKLERIPAVLQALPLQARAHSHRPAPGESLLLTYGEAADADRLATLSNGMTLRLTDLGPWRQQLRPGDTLRVRVLANEPVLELEVESGPVSRRARDVPAEDDVPASITRHAAMRLDQAALRRMRWQAPNPAALARSWYDLALERWGTLLTALRSSVVSPATMIGPPPYREPAGAPVPNPDPLLLPVYAWGGVQMMLRLPYAAQRERGERKDRKPRQHGPLLRLELAPPAIGAVVLDAYWLAGGVDLTISVHEPHAADLVTRALPRIVHALTQAAVPITGVRVLQGDVVAASYDPPAPGGDSPQPVGRRSLPALFRALAETAVILLQVVP